MGHEIITIQLGGQANYLGTHFWNTQDSYFAPGNDDSPIDADVNWKEGEGLNRQSTITPRALVYDFRPRFGTLRQVGGLYEEPGQSQAPGNAWGDNVATYQEAPIEPSPFITQLDSGQQPDEVQDSQVRYWSDYASVYYHPSSLVPISSTLLDPGQRGFERWQDGVELWEAMKRENDVYDEQLRPLLEDCDGLQGLQVLTSTDDGWSGFASKYIETVADELGTKQRWIWALNGTEITGSTSLTNQALSVHGIHSLVDLYVPMGIRPRSNLNRVELNLGSRWSVSGLQNIHFESMTLPTRLRNVTHHHDRSTMNDISSEVDREGQRKIVVPAIEVLSSRYEEHRGGRNRWDPSQIMMDRPPDTESRDLTLFPTGWLIQDGGPPPEYGDRVEVLRQPLLAELNGHDSERALKRYRSDLKFPLLKSAPRTLKPLLNQGATGANIHASLEADSMPSRWCRYFIERCKPFFELAERAEICNGLSEISELYHSDMMSVDTEDMDLDDEE